MQPEDSPFLNLAFSSMVVSLIQDEDMNDYFIQDAKQFHQSESILQIKETIIEESEQSSITSNKVEVHSQSPESQAQNDKDSVKLRNSDQLEYSEGVQTQPTESGSKSQQTEKEVTITATQKQSNTERKSLECHNSDLSNVSRLQLQKQKHSLQFGEVYGEIFIAISEAYLIGVKKEQFGYLMATNYRVLFFKAARNSPNKKRVDLPFGFVSNIEYNSKRNQIIFHLRYSHYWKFSLQKHENFQTVKVMLQLYAENKNVKSSFAFSYAAKNPEFKGSNYQVLKEYVRMHLSDVSLVFPNQDFQICATYPPYMCLPRKLSESSRNEIKFISQNFKNNRLPILSYVYRMGNKDWSGIWVCSGFIDQKKVNLNEVKRYFNMMKHESTKLHFFDMGNKVNKVPSESSLDGNFVNHYVLTLNSNSQIKASYNLIVQAYLNPGLDFIEKVLSSKWYEMVLSLLHASFLVTEKLLNLQQVVLREDNSFDRAPQISALCQIILEPYYRTFRGFRSLVMKEFILMGFPCGSRGGNRESSEECPILIQFLDCVSQLIEVNPHFFEFNSKYLSKISNLMYTNIFGTFLVDSPSEFYLNNILEETVQIWEEIETDLTRNAFYQIKSGVLEKPHQLSDIRFWFEHFSYLTGQSKDSYKIHPLAETNADYVNLQCLKKIDENKNLKSEIERQKDEIKRLQELLKESKGSQTQKASKQENSN